MNPVDDVFMAVRSAIGEPPHALQRPLLGESERRWVANCDPLGKNETEIFEGELLRHVAGAKHAIAVSSGTAALHLALMAVGVCAGDEVIVPTLTFAATANAVMHCGAIPHFIDSGGETGLGMHGFGLRQYLGNRDLFEATGEGLTNRATGRRLAAVVPVHLLGVPCEAGSIRGFCASHMIPVVEDAAEALGSYTAAGWHCGTVGAAGILSFNLNKIVTTGGGGAVITSSDEIAKTVRHLATNAKVPHRFHWQHDAVGWNYRLPNVCAALGVPQLYRLKQTLTAKAELARKYEAAFANCPSAKMLTTAGNHWINAIELDPRCMDMRDAVIEALLDAGYESRALFTPLHTLPHFRDCPRRPSLMGAESLFRLAICLPSSLEAK